MTLRTTGVVLFAVGCWLTSAPCLADSHDHDQYWPPVVPACPITGEQICGDYYTLPSVSVGTLQTVTLPLRYVIGSATFQCVTDNFTSYYKLMNGDVTTCAVKTCKPSEVSVCGVGIPVSSETNLGDTVNVALPEGLLDPARISLPYNLAVACDVHNGNAQYDVIDGSALSCNNFLCRPITVTACGASFEVPQSAPLGATLNMTVLNNQKVTVQCLGSLEGAPHFAVTDSSCN